MSQYQDFDPPFLELYRRCESATMTSIERMYALYKAVEYVVDAGIPGDFVECGVWRGGSVMLMAETLLAKSVMDRTIYLYDTFDGMVAPGEHDLDLDGQCASDLLAASSDRERDLIWALAPLDQVKANLAPIGYPVENYRFVVGKVEHTIPDTLPGDIALLRLDTDWYESTRHELDHLYPVLRKGGVLIIDDYGHWRGSRRAVDDFFGARRDKLLLNRIDYTGRIGIKTSG